jgi:hypothetical protein
MGNGEWGMGKFSLTRDPFPLPLFPYFVGFKLSSTVLSILGVAIRLMSRGT